MLKYRVIELSGIDQSIGLKVGDVVRCRDTEIHLPIKMCLLPYRLKARGHYGRNEKSKKRNQWAFASVSLTRIMKQGDNNGSNQV